MDDCDFFDHAVLEYYNEDGEWKALTEELVNQYDITFVAEKNAPVARYVRLRRLDSERKNYFTARIFDVNPAKAVSGNAESYKLMDENPSTYYVPDEILVLPVPENVSKAVILTKSGATVNGILYDRPFVEIGSLEQTLEIAPGAQIHEIIFM